MLSGAIRKAAGGQGELTGREHHESTRGHSGASCRDAAAMPWRDSALGQPGREALETGLQLRVVPVAQ